MRLGGPEYLAEDMYGGDNSCFFLLFKCGYLVDSQGGERAWAWLLRGFGVDRNQGEGVRFSGRDWS